MSRHEDIDNAIWSDLDFVALSPAAKLIYIWSWTNPRCGMAGLYKVIPALGQVETGFDETAFQGALEELGRARFAYYEDGVMFVRSRVKHMRQKTEQIAKSIRSDVSKIAPDHPMRHAWIAENAAAPWLLRLLGAGWETDGPATLDRGSSEGRAVGSLEPDGGASVEGRSTLPGNGNGNGPGNGPRGRGAGEGATDFFAIADELGVDHGFVKHYLDHLKLRKQKPTAAVMRSLLAKHSTPEAA